MNTQLRASNKMGPPSCVCLDLLIIPAWRNFSLALTDSTLEHIFNSLIYTCSPPKTYGLTPLT